MNWQESLQARWGTLAVREQRGLGLAALVLGVAVVWGILVAPALRTLKSVDAQKAALSQDMEHMLSLQAQARALQAKPAVAAKDALQSLQAAATALGKRATLQTVGEQSTLTLKQLNAAEMAQWLTPQSGVALNPLEAHLQRDLGAAEPLWSGTLVYRLPAGSGATP